MNANLERLVDGAVDFHTHVASTRDFKRGVRGLIAEAYRMGTADAAEAAKTESSQSSDKTGPRAKTTKESATAQDHSTHLLAKPAAAPSQPAVRPSSSGIAQTAQTATGENGQDQAERQRAADATARL